MPKISVALIFFAVLCLLAASLWKKRQDSAAVTPFLVVAVLSAAQALLVSLRWDFGLTLLRVPQVLVASAMPSIAWIAFRAVTSGRAMVQGASIVHAVPSFLVLLTITAMPDAIDIVLICTFLTYGTLFLRLALSDDTSFSIMALEGVFDMRRGVWLLAFTMLGSATVDLLVLLDFMRGGGQHAALLIGLGNLAWLMALGVSVVLGSSTLPAVVEEANSEQNAAPHQEDHQIALEIQNLLVQTTLAKDPNLTLSRLARRLGVSARAVSSAINRVHGKNVSQYINDIRIAEACKLLQKADVSITQVIYECGFQTKSNFNREFLRVTGRTPRDWRKTFKTS
jgi:AraC-like DNA-binding protein